MADARFGDRDELGGEDSSGPTAAEASCQIRRSASSCRSSTAARAGSLRVVRGTWLRGRPQSGPCGCRKVTRSSRIWTIPASSRRRERIGGYVEQFGCREHGPQVTGLLGGGEQQHGLGGVRQASNPLKEDALEVVAQREPIGQRARRRCSWSSLNDAGSSRRSQRVARGEVDEQRRAPAARGADPRRAGRCRRGRRARRGALGRPADDNGRLLVADREEHHDPSASSRRATKVKASAEGSSSHCASSIRHSTGRSRRHRPACRECRATPGTCRRRPRAQSERGVERRALASGKRRRVVHTGRSNWCTAANGNSDSDSIPAPRRTLKPSARASGVVRAARTSRYRLAAQDQRAASARPGGVESARRAGRTPLTGRAA